MLGQSGSILRESYKDSLRDILGGVWLASHAKGSRVNEVNVSSDQFSECGFRAMLGEIS